MIYYVQINDVFLYCGKSHGKAQESLELAHDLIQSCNGSGAIRYCNANATGTYNYIGGEYVR